MKFIYSFLAFLILLMASCTIHNKIIKPKKIASANEIKVSANHNPMDIFRAAATKNWTITHTRVALSFNFENKTANGSAWIHLHPYSYAADSLILDAKSMDILQVAIENSTVNFTKEYNNNQLVLHFNHSILPNDSIVVFIQYLARPNDSKVNDEAAITDDKGLYFVNTDKVIPNKPVQIWTQGETESNSHWMPTIDKPNTRFTTEIELTIPDSLTTLSNGYLVKSSPVEKGLRTDYWRMDQSIQAYAVMFAIGNFSIIKDKWESKEVNYYTEPAFAPFAAKIFQHTPQMIQYFSSLTGVPFPWNKYSQVVVRDYVSGAMENTSASLFGEFMNQTDREIADKNYEDVVSHELFHQWFGDYVTAESWSNLTLNESFANFGEQLWRRHFYGDESADQLAYDDLSKYIVNAAYNDPSLLRFHYREELNMFDHVSYNKGGAILNYLRTIIGDEQFFKAMQIYLTKNAYQSAEVSDWRKAVEEATGKDFMQFFDQWYVKPGHPELKVKYEYIDSLQQLKVSINQKTVPDSTMPIYELPFKAELFYNAEKSVINVVLNKRNQTFFYPYKNGIKPLFIPDPQRVLPAYIMEEKSVEDWLKQLTVSQYYAAKIRAISNSSNFNDKAEFLSFYEKGLADKSFLIRKFTLEKMYSFDKQDWKDKLTPTIKYLAYHENNNLTRAAAIKLIGYWKLNQELNTLKESTADSSYAVAGAALEAAYKINKDSGYSWAKQLINTHPKAELKSTIWQNISSFGNPADFAIFENQIKNSYENSKLFYTTYLVQYAQSVSDTAVFRRSIKHIENLVVNEQSTKYRYYLGENLVTLPQIYKEKMANEKNKMKIIEFGKMKAIIESSVSEILKSEKSEENLKKYKELND